MRIEDRDPAQQARAKGSFQDQLKKVGAKPKPGAAPKAVGKRGANPNAKVVAKPTAAPPDGKELAAPRPHTAQLGKAALHAQTLVKGQVQKDAAVRQGHTADLRFDHGLTERRTDAEAQRPELRRVAETLAKLLAEPPREAGRAAPSPSPPPRPPRAGDGADPGERASTAPSIEGVHQPVGAPQQVQAPEPAARAEALTQQIERLVEHAELLSKAEGPALQLSLSEGRAARVEVTRTGKGEVSLRLEARGGNRRALEAQVSQIRAALADRGVTVREVKVS